MPLPSQKASLEKNKQIMPQIFDGGKNDVGQSDENSRRRGTAAVQAVITPAKAAPAAEAQPQIPGSTPTPPPPATIWDRVHKHAETKYGGYVIVGPVHDQSDGDPFKNSGYPVFNDTAATLNVGLAKAAQMLAKVKPSERVALIILSSGWTENLIIDNPNIDLFGIGQPRIRGQVTIGPQSDASCYNIDFIATDSTLQAVFVLAKPLAPGTFDAVPPGFYGCRFYSSMRAVYIQRRFHMEDCQIFQTAHMVGQNDWVQEYAAMKVEAPVGDAGWSDMTRCKIFAWIDQSDPFNPKPGGWSVHVRANIPGGTYIGKLGDSDCYAHNTGLLFVHCELYGTMLAEQWTAKLLYCSVVSSTTTTGHPAPGVGDFFVRLRGQPLGSPDFYADAPAMVFFDYVHMRASAIAQSVTWPTNIGIHYGRSYVAFRNSEQMADFRSPVATTFMSDSLGIGIADVVHSTTPAALWNPGGANWDIENLVNSDTSVTANRDLYVL